MDLVKKLTIHAREYTVTLRRFDDVIDPQHGAEYHGYYLDIQSQHTMVTARIYDDEDDMSIQKGVNPKDSTLVEDLRQIAKDLFGRNTLLLLNHDRKKPYHPL